MPLWHRHPRAVFLALQLRHSRHVLSAHLFNPAASPYPFGLGVYALQTPNKRFTKRDQLPLLYVSHEVAVDRSPAEHEKNAPGVREGWYVIAEPGMEFEVRITCLNSNGLVKDSDIIRGELYVDGINTHCCLDAQKDGVRWELIAKGFLTEQKKVSKSKISNKVKLFAFTEASVCEGDDDEDPLNIKSGQISLAVSAGTISKGEQCSDDWSEEDECSGFVTEKMVHKKGMALQAGGSSVVTEVEEAVSSSGVTNLVRWHEADLTLHVRKASWMRSRRLIDDNSSPCTFEMYQELLKSDAIVETTTTVKQEDSLPKKRRRRLMKHVSSDEEDAGSNPDEKRIKLKLRVSKKSTDDNSSCESSPDASPSPVRDYIDLTM